MLREFIDKCGNFLFICLLILTFGVGASVTGYAVVKYLCEMLGCEQP